MNKNIYIGSNRWMPRGASGLIIDPSGVDGPSFLLQMAACSALGVPFFGMPFNRKRRTLFIQSTLNKGDVAELIQGIRDGMDLNASDCNLLQKNLFIISDSTSAGSDFIQKLERQISRYRAEVVFCNPLNSYLGGDPDCQDATVKFFGNEGINGVLQRTNVILFFGHRTKPEKTGPVDQQCECSLSSGSSSLIDWVRTVIALREERRRIDVDGVLRRTFSVNLQKRGSDAGFCDKCGRPVSSKFFIWPSAGGTYWERAE